MTIKQKVIDIVAEQMQKDPQHITPDTQLSELGVDSLDRVELIIQLEDEFQIEICDEDIEQLLIVQDLISYINNRALQNDTF